MSYSDIVLEHFYHPRNCRVMEKPDAVGVAGEPARGNFMVVYLRTSSDRIVEASFQTHGCCPSIAAGSLLTERLRGKSREDAAGFSEEVINDALGGLPGHKRYCSALAATALRMAIESWARGEEGSCR